MFTVTPNATEPVTVDTNVLKSLLLTQQWASIANHLRANPIDAEHPLEINDVKALPLHIACAISAPIGVIKTLIAAYSNATQMKNDSARLPLHCLFLHRCPNITVLSTIIEAYPAACHITDGNGKLAIHYACEQSGVTDDFFTILLSTYPEGAYARDSSGKFPINYATSNKDAITKKCALAALDRGTLFASISKMTSIRVEESHSKKLNEMENRAADEKAKLQAEIDSLESQLQDVSVMNQTLKGELDAAEGKKNDAIKMIIGEEQAKADELEKGLRMELADVQLKNMDMVDQLENLQHNLDDCIASDENKAEEICALKVKLNGANDEIASLKQENASKCNYIDHLEESLLKAQKVVMELAGKQEEMQVAINNQKEMFNTVLMTQNTTLAHAGGLYVDMVSLADDIGGTIKARNKEA